MVVAAAIFLLAAPQLDSAALLRHARHSQADFEWRRTALLPLGSARTGGVGECDAVIGRFCYWHDASPPDPPAEPAEIAAARDRLIAVLDSVADSLPDNAWIAGQRVRYLLEAGHPGAALRRLRSCGAPRWWCDALEGLVRHVAGDFVTADSLFHLALEEMPREERCRWTDLSPLVEGALRRRYRGLDCEQRQVTNRRIWWLAQPLLSRAGNDRRTEHFARLTMAATWRHAASPYGPVSRDDLTELLERYGWPVAWARSSGGAGLDAPRIVIGSEREPAFHFVPESLALPGASEQQDRPWARERYAPAYVDTFTFFVPQVAAFRRGDSSVVVARFDVGRDPLFRGTAPAVALVLARDALTGPVVARRSGVPDSGILVARAPWVARFVSLEITARGARRARRAARGRAGLRDLQPGNPRLMVSDLLPFEPGDSLPRGLEAVLPHVHSLRELRRGSRVGLYWEVYGVAATGEPLAVSVSVAPARRGWLSRAFRSLGLGRRPRRVEVAWRETTVPRSGVAARALVVDLSSLPAGDYRIAVRVRGADGVTAGATRALRIVSD